MGLGGNATVLCLGICSTLLLTGNSVSADEDRWTAEYLRHGTSIRGRGLGGAYVSLVDEPLAVLYNPAGIMRCGGLELASVIDIQGSNTFRFTSALVAPRSSWLGDFWGKYVGFGLGWTQDHSWGIDTSTALGRNGLSSSVTDGAIYASMAAEWDVSGRVNIAAGITGKILYMDLGRYAASSGVDWGLQIQPLKFGHATPKKILLPLRLGFVQENVHRPRFITQTGDVLLLETRTSLALSYGRFPLVGSALESAMTIQGTGADGIDPHYSCGAEIVAKLGESASVAMQVGRNLTDGTWTMSVGIRSSATSSGLGADVLVCEQVRSGGKSECQSKASSVGLTYTISPTNAASTLLTKADLAGKDMASKKYYAWQLLSRYPNSCVCEAARLLGLQPDSTETFWYFDEFDCKDVPRPKAPPSDSIQTVPEGR